LSDQIRGFGERLRAHRRSALLSQQELAERSGLSVRSIGDLERGRTRWPYPGSLRRLADALELRDEARVEFIAAASRRLASDSDRASGSDGASNPAGPAGGAGRHADRRVMPRQLPPPPGHFVARTAELQELNALLNEAADGGMIVISAIGGTAGLGKTALAVHWAHQVAARFPDGQLYVNLRGFAPSGPPVTAVDVIRGFLEALEMPPQRIPSSPDAQTGLYRSLLASKQMLILLDNAEDEHQVRPLLPGSPGHLVIVTSRSQLTGLVAADGARPLILDLLDTQEACELLASRLGTGRVAAEPEAITSIIESCARLPLALALTAARAAQRPGLPLAALASQLRYTQGRLDALDAEDPATSVWAVFSWSYDKLSGPTARMFRLLGVHPGPDISAPAAASLVGIPLREALKTLSELISANLINEHIPGRYAFHDLLRAYAAEQARTQDSEHDRGQAIHRMLDHYLHTADAAASLLSPARDPLPLPPPQPGVTPEELTSSPQALAWFEAEQRVLPALITIASRFGFGGHAWQLPWTLGRFLGRRGYWQEWTDVLSTALTAASGAGDLGGQARIFRHLGVAEAGLGSSDNAHAHLVRALDLSRELGDRIGQALTHHSLAWEFERRDRYDEALTHAQHALDLYLATGHRAGQAEALNAIGWCQGHLGDCQQAARTCRQAIGLYAQLGDRAGEAFAWDSLAYTYGCLGDHDQALTCYQHALDLTIEVGDHYYQAVRLIHLGDGHDAVGDGHAARVTRRRALAILDELHHPDAGQVRARLSALG
jgi:tetratricopeptide (TPR) repeat protein/transcriptional regulator with XRE-family HTH domain